MNEALKASLPVILAVGAPSLMVLVGILLNQNAVNGMRMDLRDLKVDLRDLKLEVNGLRGEIVAMRDSFHGDIVMLVQRDGDKDTRLALLEERTKPNR